MQSSWARKHKLAVFAAQPTRLIRGKVKMDEKDHQGNTALLFAAAKGNVDIVEALLEGGASINVEDVGGSSPLGLAAGKGHNPVVKVLLERGAQLNHKDAWFHSPLGYAAGSGFKDCVDLLLDAGAVLGMKDESGTTPRSWAIRNGHEAIAGVPLKMENNHNADQLPVTDHKDETDVKIAPCSKSEDGHGWPGWLADTAGQDNSRSTWQKTNLSKSFEMTSAS